MGIEDILALPAWERVYLVEIEPAKRLDLYAWTQDGGYTNCWYYAHDEDVVRIEEVGVDLTDRGSLTLCNNNPGSFYYDDSLGRIYVHTTGSDTPKNYIIGSFFWVYFTNQQFEDEPVIHNGNYYLPYLDSDNMPSVRQATSDYYAGGTKYAFGSIKLINDGYFDTKLSQYFWESKKIILRVGTKGSNYNDFGIFWIGWTGDIHWNDEEVEVEIEDLRR